MLDNDAIYGANALAYISIQHLIKNNNAYKMELVKSVNMIKRNPSSKDRAIAELAASLEIWAYWAFRDIRNQHLKSKLSEISNDAIKYKKISSHLINSSLKGTNQPREQDGIKEI